MDQLTNPKEQLQLEEMTRVTTYLNSTALSNIPKLQERIFVQVFLPLFTGDETNLYNASFQTWVDFAKSPYTKVHVIDNSGNILFTVPPLFDRDAVNSISNSNVSMAHVVATAKQYSKIHPVQGSTYLENELDKRAMIMKVPTNMLNHLSVWNSIFKRYNRPEIMPYNEQTSAVVEDIKIPFDDFEPL